ncbi:MAG: peptidoglycan-binding domain-containing protein [Methylococcales bacterium]
MKNTLSFISASLIVFLIGGCSSTATKQQVDLETENQATGMAQSIADEQARSAEMLRELQAENARLARQNESLSESSKQAMSSSASAGNLLPPNAKTGECYARVLTPATYSDTSERVERKPASYRMEVIPAKYSWGEEKVLVKEAGEKLKIIPATYTWVEEKVLVHESIDTIVSVPAKYKTVQEKILVKPAYTTWKKGKGPIQKVDNSTGEIMCLVEVPAQYKTVVREELVEQATTKKTQLPAQYKTIKKRVVAEPEKVVRTPVAAEYKTVRVKKLLNPTKETRIEIPAQFANVTKRSKVTDSSLEWRSILCETNTTPGVIRKMQQALTTAGFNSGSTDGRIGSRTMSALTAYQTKKGLASGQITMETLRSLGVAY